MRAALTTELGRPPELGERPEPAGAAVYEISAVSLNPVDINIGAGRLPDQRFELDSVEIRNLQQVAIGRGHYHVVAHELSKPRHRRAQRPQRDPQHVGQSLSRCDRIGVDGQHRHQAALSGAPHDSHATVVEYVDRSQYPDPHRRPPVTLPSRSHAMSVDDA